MRRLGIAVRNRGVKTPHPAPPPPNSSQLTVALRDPRSQPPVFAALFNHLRPRLHHLLRGLGLDAAEIDDGVQEAITHLTQKAHRAPPDLESPLGWVWTVASNKARDFAREHRRRPRRAEGSEADRALETGGAAAWKLEGMRERALAEAEALDWFEQVVACYVERAERSGKARRGHHIRAWVDVQVRGEAPVRVAERLAAERGEAARVETVWKWSQRGRQLAVELAATDDDLARAALIRRVAASTARAAA